LWKSIDKPNKPMTTFHTLHLNMLELPLHKAVAVVGEYHRLFNTQELREAFLNRKQYNKEQKNHLKKFLLQVCVLRQQDVTIVVDTLSATLLADIVVYIVKYAKQNYDEVRSFYENAMTEIDGIRFSGSVTNEQQFIASSNKIKYFKEFADECVDLGCTCKTLSFYTEHENNLVIILLPCTCLSTDVQYHPHV